MLMQLGRDSHQSSRDRACELAMESAHWGRLVIGLESLAGKQIVVMDVRRQV